MIRKGLAILVIILFIGMVLTPSISSKIEQSSISLGGDILYVGGDGPGNYTKIQDAIDNASDGDTVFVYDDSSPYYENIIIHKSINLVGENRDTTTIDGSYIGDVVILSADNVFITGFTLQNNGQGPWDHAITTSGTSNVNISDCVVVGNSGGIRFNSVSDSCVTNCYIHNNSWCSITVYTGSGIMINNCRTEYNGVGNQPGEICLRGVDDGFVVNATISNCYIHNNNFAGISVARSKKVEIYQNNIYRNTGKGIFISGSDGPCSDITVHNNTISGNGVGDVYDSGIDLQDCTNAVTIKHNNILSNNLKGIYLLRSSGNIILENNLIDNPINAFFRNRIRSNHWDRNFWDNWIGLKSGLFEKIPKVITGSFLFIIPLVNFDWHPAQQPYDI